MTTTRTRIELAGLTTYIVAPAGTPTLTCVLLHGFGAPGDDLVPLAGALDRSVRYVFPEAPLVLGGMYGNARAWWLLDLAQLEDDQRRGVARDRGREVPDGLLAARAQLLAMLAALEAREAIAPNRIVIGGFSQGAMLSLDVALHREVAPAGLLLMSGTLIAEALWQPRMASLAGVPVMMSHGRHDPLLPFAAAEGLRDQLTAGGAVVDWQPFAGGHEIPTVVVAAATKLLRRVA